MLPVDFMRGVIVTMRARKMIICLPISISLCTTTQGTTHKVMGAIHKTSRVWYADTAAKIIIFDGGTSLDGAAGTQDSMWVRHFPTPPIQKTHLRGMKGC